LSLLDSRPLTYPFENTATPTAAGVTSAAIITMGENPWVLNSMELATITASANANPSSLYLQFNVFDSDNEGIFGGPTAPRASTVFGYPIQVPYAVQPVKVFPPRTKLRIEWTNLSSIPLGFEMLFNGIEILAFGPTGKNKGKSNGDEVQVHDMLEELLYERRTR
jgi:hypothetical protein